MQYRMMRARASINRFRYAVCHFRLPSVEVANEHAPNIHHLSRRPAAHFASIMHAIARQLRQTAINVAGVCRVLNGEVTAIRALASDRMIDNVVDRLVDRLARGDFHPDSELQSSSAGSPGGAGEAGGGDRPLPSRRAGAAIVYDYEAVPRSIDVEAFRKALANVLTETAGAAGGGAGGGRGGDMASQLLGASPTERQAIAEKLTHKMPEKELSRMLAEEPVPVVRSRLAGMLQRSGF